MTTLAIVDDVIELNGVPVARLPPNLRLSLRDQLLAFFAVVALAFCFEQLDVGRR